MKKTIIVCAVASVFSSGLWAVPSSDEDHLQEYLAYRARLDAEQDKIILAAQQEQTVSSQSTAADSVAFDQQLNPSPIYSAVISSAVQQADHDETISAESAASARSGIVQKTNFPEHSSMAAPQYDGALAYADNCVGSVVSSQYVISAGHCGNQTGKSVSIKSADGTIKILTITDTLLHPLYDDTFPRVYDVAIWKLNGVADQTKYLADHEPAIGSLFDGLSMKGGEFRSYRVRATGPADPRFSPDGFEGLYSPSDTATTGHSIPGDSGGACVGGDARVWGVVQGSAGQGDGTYIQSCQNLANSNTKQWLLETINAWSYPRVVKGDGSLVVQIQNLHQGAEFLNPTVEGSVVIDSNSCAGAVQPWGVCQLTLSGSGKVKLSVTDEIKVNEPIVVPPEPPKPDGNGGGGGGGSTGPVALVMLALAAFARRFKSRSTV
ncbi:trypsin-like serine protease [Aeromonas sp. Y311-2]|uniref:trypsin-like serine protease n=1 Tax=Aeromonas sp. Y311-2 TaxID=2990507 RepID=UPI0022E76909|nr:trypsin-like serine protease [Aeromonas sp. Y311-2]